MDKAKGGRIEGGRWEWGEWGGWGHNKQYMNNKKIKINKLSVERKKLPFLLPNILRRACPKPLYLS